MRNIQESLSCVKQRQKLNIKSKTPLKVEKKKNKSRK